jgi:PadR family transcriptional regulator, regulatory protein PadR
MDLQGHLDLLLLSTLRRLGSGHGYALIGAMSDASGGCLRLAEGTVYPALQRLERAGAVRSAPDRVRGRPRRVYRLTTAGEVLLAERRRRWEVFVAGVHGILGDGANGPTLEPCAPSPPPPSRSPRSPGP